MSVNYSSQNLSDVIPTTTTDRSTWASVKNGVGLHCSNTITLSANNTSASENIFTVTGTVVLLHLHGEIKTAGTLTNCTAVDLDVWDGTTSVLLSKTDSGVISGFGVESVIAKTEEDAQDLLLHNSDQVRVTEPTGKVAFSSAIVTAKEGATTYLRFNYTTTDAPIDATIEFHVLYLPINGGACD